MPPISQQGSRGGLITAMVIFAILFLTAAIFAIYFNVNMRAEQDKYVKLQTTYKNVITDSSLVPESEVGTAVTAARTDPALADTANLKWVDVLMQRGDRLAKVIEGGANTSGLTAETDTATRIAAANEKLRQAKLTGVTVAPDNLLGTIDSLVKTLISKDQSLAAATTNMNAKLTDNQKMVAGSMTSIEESKKAVEAATADAEKTRADAAADRTAKQAQLDAMADAIKKASDDSNAALQKQQLDLTSANNKNTQLAKEIDLLKQKQARFRIDTVESTVRRADGSITSIGANNTCYINLGQGDQVVAGMTFEVYDKAEGIPALGADGLRDDDMPIGKGSIEIVHVGAATSECRIVKVTPGSGLSEGDIIANLVYDPNVKFNFNVFGKFDLDRNGIATDGDTEVMKRLVTQWGGKVTDQVNADTDFVVLGKEPELPSFSKDELDLPENAKKLADAQAEQDAYQKVKADARELHIPVMNQNRFLYFVGFYDQSKR